MFDLCYIVCYIIFNKGGAIMKYRIIIETTKENKEQLQELAKAQGLTLKDYLVLTGLKKLKVK